MALRFAAAVTVPITGPRSRAVGAPQRIGKRGGARLPGWEVSLICPVPLLMAVRSPLLRLAEKQKALNRRGVGRKASKSNNGVKRPILQGLTAPLRSFGRFGPAVTSREQVREIDLAN